MPNGVSRRGKSVETDGGGGVVVAGAWGGDTGAASRRARPW